MGMIVYLRLTFLLVYCNVLFQSWEVVFTTGHTVKETFKCTGNITLYTSPEGSKDPDSCISGQFDAITRTSDGHTYAFKDAVVLQVDEDGSGVAPGYPKATADVFPGIPSTLDAAVFWNNGKTYFFKGYQYWATSGAVLEAGYPRNISADWSGVPNDIDAAFVSGAYDKGYFIKERKYWRYNATDNDVEMGNTTTLWSGYDQGTVDAVFQWSSGVTYIFKGERYWRYNDITDMVDSGYPKYTTKVWLACTTNGATVPMASVVSY